MNKLSLFAGILSASLLLFIGLSFITPVSSNNFKDSRLESIVCETVSKWREKYKNSNDLQVAYLDINFSKEPKYFKAFEGTVITPIGINLFNAQEILEMASFPQPLRTLTVDGITCLSWEYPGSVNKDLRYIALTLVRRPQKTKPVLPSAPTFYNLPPDLHDDALATAKEIEEHSLNECANFDNWVKEISGKPPYTDQFLRIIKAIKSNIVKDDDKNVPDDICSSIREKKFSLHRAHVLAVMSARQLNIPAFGFASASPKQIYLAGIYTDQAGWLLVDIENPEEGYFTGGPVLLTKTPLLNSFEGSRHDFWYPEAAAYVSAADYGYIKPYSITSWAGRLSSDKSNSNTTQAKSVFLKDICK